MLKGIFNPQNYFWNPTAIPTFFSGVLVFLEGFGIYYKGRHNLLNRVCFLWYLLIALWLFGQAMCYAGRISSVGLFWYKYVSFSGVCFISIAGYWFSLVLFKDSRERERQRLLLYSGLVLMSIFYVINLFSATLVTGVRKYSYGYYPLFGTVGAVFLVCWCVFFVLTWWNFFINYRRSQESQTKKQLLFITIATVLGYFGAIDFAPGFEINIYPFGFVPVVIWLSLNGFAIIRYRALGIDTVIHRTVLWFITSLWLILPAYVVFDTIRPWLQALNTFSLSIAALGLFYGFLWYYRYFQPKIDHLFRRRKYDYYTVLGELGQKIGSELELEKVQSRLFRELKEILYIRNGVLLVKQSGWQDYEKVGSVGYERERSSENGVGTKLSQYLNREQRAIEREQIEADPLYQDIKEEALRWLKNQKIEVLIPTVVEGKVNGLVGLGKKENLQSYTQRDIELLEKMGKQLGITIDNALHHGDIVEKERLAEELKLGREIQENLLPKTVPQTKGLKLAGMMIPAKEIGGDYYDYIVTQHSTADKLGVAIGDVSGKGVAAGLIMATAKATLKGLSQQGLTPKEMLTQANSIIHEYTQGSKFMTMLYFQWDSQQKKMSYSSAGHEHILIYRSGKVVGDQREETASDKVVEPEQKAPDVTTVPLYHSTTASVEVIQSGGFMLGMMPEIGEMLEDRDLQLSKGDKVVLYTDGVTEARNQQEEMYSLGRLAETVKQHGHKSCTELIGCIKDNVYTFIGTAEQYDDITLVVMEAEE